MVQILDEVSSFGAHSTEGNMKVKEIDFVSDAYGEPHTLKHDSDIASGCFRSKRILCYRLANTEPCIVKSVNFATTIHSTCL
jgi:hypothetical protein